MKNYLLLIIAVLLLIPVSGISQDDICGKIIISADEWPTSNTGYSSAASGSTDQFVKNVADYFTGGYPGHFLIASSNLAYQSSFKASLTAGGHTFDVDPNATDYSWYDAVFIGGKLYDVSLVQNYIDGGGGVYCVCGTAGIPGGSQGETDHLNALFNKYGFEFDNWPGTPPGLMVSNFYHSIFNSVQELYTYNPNVLMTLSGHPHTSIISDQYNYNWWGLYEGPCEYNPEDIGDLVLWYDANNIDPNNPNFAVDSFFDIWHDLTFFEEDASAPSDNQRPMWRQTGINGYPGVEFTTDYTNTGYGFSDILVAPYHPEITTDNPLRWEPDNRTKSYYMIIKTGPYVNEDPDNPETSPYYSDGRQCIFEVGGPLSGLNTYISNEKICVGAWNRFEQKYTILDPNGTYHSAEGGAIYYVRYSYDGLDRKIETSIGKYEPTGTTITTAGPLSFQGLTDDVNYPDDMTGVGGASRTRYHDYSTGETYSDHFGGLIGEILMYNDNIPLEGDILAYFDSKFGTNFATATVVPYSKENDWIIIDRTEATGDIQLSTAYPNPFATTSSFAVNMPEAMNVKVELVDATGNLVQTIYNGSLAKGMHDFKIDGANLSEGMYMFRVTGDGFIKSGKVICIK